MGEKKQLYRFAPPKLELGEVDLLSMVDLTEFLFLSDRQMAEGSTVEPQHSHINVMIFSFTLFSIE